MAFGWGGAAAGAAGALRQQQQDALEAALAQRKLAQMQAEQDIARQRLGIDQQQLGLQRDQFGLQRQKFDTEQTSATAAAQERAAQQQALRDAADLAGQKNPLVGKLILAGKATASDALKDPEADLQREIQKARAVGDINRANTLQEIAARTAGSLKEIGARGATDAGNIRLKSDLERQQAAQTAQGGTAPESAIERANLSRTSIKNLMGHVSPLTVGPGSITSIVPGSPARNFAAQLDTLKANIAFNALAQMRAESKTGGALGQVSDREEKLLSATLGALDTGQSPENFRRQLQQIDDSLARWQAAHGVGAAPAAAGGPPPPQGQTRRGRYNPATGKVEY